MLRGLYTSATAMMAYSRRMDVISNNLTNVETAGFKQDTMTTRSFADALISRINDPSVYQYTYVGPHNFGMHVDQTFTSFTQGALEETTRPLDLALEGDGFFVVDYISSKDAKTDDGEAEFRFTRSGNFALDADGYLVTPDGYYVQGKKGPILPGSPDFVVDEQGNLFAEDGTFVDKLRIVRFEDNTVLRKSGDNTFRIFDEVDPDDGELSPAAAPIDIDMPAVHQGFVEGANVDEAREMVRMMETYRSYEVNQKMLTMFDETLRLTVNDVGKV